MTETFFTALTTGQVRRHGLPFAEGTKMFRTAAASIARAARRYRDRRHLEQAPDHVLRDLGIDRSEIRSIVRHGSDRSRRRRGAK